MATPPGGVLSGIIPVLKLGSTPTSTFSKRFFETLTNQAVGPNSGPFNQLGGTLLSNLGQASLSWAVNQQLGAEVAKDLGYGAVGQSNFLSAIDAPNLLQTGVGSLFTVAEDSIRNSKALGPFGPLASDIVKSYRGAAIEGLTNLVFGPPGEQEDPFGVNGTNYFPGADGEGEGRAVYGGAAYNASSGSGDVVFSIRYASTAAQDDLLQEFGTYGTSVGNVPNYSSVFTSPASVTQENATSASSSVSGSPAKVEAVNTVSQSRSIKGFENTSYFYTEVAKDLNFTRGSLPSFTENYSKFLASNWSAPSWAYPAPPAWRFICPPEDISWDTTAQVDRVPIYGANRAPVNAGVKGMRELSLNGAIVEGFTRGKTVEDKIIALEKLMEMSLSGDKKYVTVPIYRVAAQDKAYGKGIDDGGFFIIKSIKVQEKLRDFSGKTTRAIVDIGLTQVPSYQVANGRDLASKALASTKGPFTSILDELNKQMKSLATQANQNVPEEPGTTGQDSKAPPAARPSGGTPIPGLGNMRG